MSWTELDFEARRAAHRRGHSKPMRDRAALDRSYDATASAVVSIPVTQFVSDGVLTDANIDDAIDAAIAKAVSLTGPGLEGTGFEVTVPAGKWTLSRSHAFPSFEEYRCMVGFRGAGMNETVFLVNSDATGSRVFTFGNASTTGVPFTMYLRISGFSVIGAEENNCNRSAIRVYGAVNPVVSDVRVRGLNSADCTYDQGRGLEVLPALEDAVEVNSQFVVVRDCDFSICMTGVFIRLAYLVTLDNCHAQQNHFANSVLDAVMGVWSNSGVQFWGSQDYYRDRWYGGRNQPGVVTGFSATSGLDSGTEATCAARTGDLCLVTGLSGLDRTQDRGRWLELTPSGSTANELLVRGLYKIDSVVSDTSCWIRKGSDHDEQEDLSWQVREAAQGSNFEFCNLYDEGSRVASFGFYRTALTNGQFALDSCKTISVDYAVEADGVDLVQVFSSQRTNIEKVAHLRVVASSQIDAPLGDIDVDDYSYPGLVCRADDLLMTGRTQAGWRDAGGVGAVRLRDICERIGAVEMWDVRVASSVALDSTDVESVTGLINGTEILPSYEGRYAQWVSNDATFGSPCVANVEGAVNVDGAGMRATIDDALLPGLPYTATVVLIGRLESATPLAAEARRVEVRTTDLQQKFALADGTWTDSNLVLTEGPSTGNVLTVLTPAVDTAAHCWIWGRHPNWLNVISSDDGEDYRGNNAAFVEWASHTVGENMGLRLADGTDATFVRPFRWAFCAVFPRALSHAEHRQIMGAARNEFNLEA